MPNSKRLATAVNAVTVAICALHDLFVAKGVLLPGELAEELRQRIDVADVDLSAKVAELAEQLDRTGGQPLKLVRLVAGPAND